MSGHPKHVERKLARLDRREARRERREERRERREFRRFPAEVSWLPGSKASALLRLLQPWSWKVRVLGLQPATGTRDEKLEGRRKVVVRLANRRTGDFMLVKL